MCEVAESTIQEALLAALVSPESKDAGAVQEDLLRVAQGRHACLLHATCAFRNLVRSGHAVPDGSGVSDDPMNDPKSRWHLAVSPTPSQENARITIGSYSYSPTDELGRGKLGVVVRGRNEFLHRDVAIKFLSREYTDNKNFRQKFEREARILARLDHPNIVKVYDGGRSGDNFFIAMEYIPGGTLADLARKSGRLAPRLVAEYMLQVVEALAAADQLGIQHRDVKPENIMVTPNGVKLADFNLASLDENAIEAAPSAFESVASEVGKPPRIVGTVLYVAPERVTGQRGDRRADMYSLGATFYTLAKGGYLFDGLGTRPDDYMGWLLHHAKEKPPALTEKVPGFPPALATIIHRCLEKDPVQRYSSYDELLRDLSGVLANKPSSAAPTSRRRQALAAGLLAVIALSAAFAWSRLTDSHSGGPSTGQELGVTSPQQLDNAKQEPDRTALGTSEPLSPETAKTSPSESPQPTVPPTLFQRLRSHPPLSEDEKVVLKATRRAFAGIARATSVRIADPILSQLAALESDGRHTPYTRQHLEAATQLAQLVKDSVSARISELRESKERVELVRSDGTSVSGIVGPSDGKSLTLIGDSERVTVLWDSLALTSLCPRNGAARPRLALRAFSGEAGNVFAETLSHLEEIHDLALWLPPFLVLAREDAERFAAQGKFKEALQVYRLLEEKRAAVTEILPYLAAEFDEIGRESAALDLLTQSRWPEVLAGASGTQSHPLAAARLYESLASQYTDDLLVSSRALTEWELYPEVSDDSEQFAHFDIERGTQAVILRDWKRSRDLVRRKDTPTAPFGLIVTFEYNAGSELASPNFRIPIEAPGKGSRYVRFDGSTVAVCESLTGAERVRKAVPQKSDSRWRSLALFAAGGHLFVYVDRQFIFCTSLDEGALTRRVSVGVFGAEIRLLNIFAKPEKPS